MSEFEQLAKDFKEAQTKAANAVEEVKGLGSELKGRMDAGDKVTGEMKSDVDQLLVKMNTLQASVDDLEQKAARSGKPNDESVQTWGERLVKSAEFAAYQKNPNMGQSARVFQTKADDLLTNNIGLEVEPTHVGMIPTPRQRLTVRDLISQGRTDSNAITYVRETGFTNSAAPVAEGALKPQSDLSFGSQTVPVATIAHYMKASRQILSDAPALASMINERLMYGLKLVEEKQLLSGDGNNGNLLGITPQATLFADPTAAGTYTIIDQLRLAVLQAVLAEYPATGHVLNPIQWAQIETAKDANGQYIIGNPQGTIAPTLWGLPVVQTQAIQAGQFLTGAFKMGAQLFDRWEASVAVATQNQDDFVKNMITVLCEERIGLAVYRPEAFIYGTLAPKV